MLLDNDERLVELFMDNVLWGNIQIKWDKIEEPKNIANEERIEYQFGCYTRLRSKNIRNEEYTHIVNQIRNFFVLHRLRGDVVGELHDREHEQTIKKLEEDNQKLVSIMADQKKQLDQLYLESPDKKNIRGIL